MAKRWVRKTFILGQKVKLTDDARQNGVRPRVPEPVMGIVRGFGHSPFLVRVQVVGQKTINSYHTDFWEPV